LPQPTEVFLFSVAGTFHKIGILVALPVATSKTDLYCSLLAAGVAVKRNPLTQHLKVEKTKATMPALRMEEPKLAMLRCTNAAPLVSPLEEYTEQDLPLTWKTKTIKRLDDNTYAFYCTSRLSTARINKNMIVIEHKGELSVINPLKLTSEGQRKLSKLGQVKHIIRLGPSMHASWEDKYYLDLYPFSVRWAPGELLPTYPPGTSPKEMPNKQSLPIDQHLTDRGSASFPNCLVFCFKHTAQAEAALLLERESHGNLLITSDCLQSQKDNEYINMPVVAKQKLDGLLESDIVVSPPWLKLMGPPPTAGIKEQKMYKKDLRSDFTRLLGLRFARLLSTSGNVVKYGAKEGAVLAVEFAFPLWGSSQQIR
jgi:hypothetical protein